MERRLEIKEPFPGLSKKQLALVELSRGKTKLMKSNSDTIRHPECFLVVAKSEIYGKSNELRKDIFPLRNSKGNWE